MSAQEPSMEDQPRRLKPRKRTGAWILALALIASAAIVALILSLLGLIGPASANSDVRLQVGKPVIVSEQELRSFGEEEAPIYWAGPRADTSYELTKNSGGAVFIRYLKQGDKAGSESKVLTVATYPEPQGYERLKAAAKSEGAGSQTTKSKALVVVSPKAPLSTYFSFPNQQFQVEAFSPTKGDSKRQVLDGKIELLGGTK